MRILALSDKECAALWDYYRPERVADIDLFISCGDLRREYLEFLVTLTNKPVLYVPGNHDKGYVQAPPEGCENIDGKLFTYRGIRFLGFGGCRFYNDNIYQYTEKQMAKRVRGLSRTLRKSGGVDVIVTHAAPTGCGDRPDPAHRGFDCYLDLMERYHPRYFVHGHVHMNYDSDIPRLMTRGETTIINAYERYTFDIDEPEGVETEQRHRFGFGKGK